MPENRTIGPGKLDRVLGPIWHEMEAETVAERLATSISSGLGTVEAGKRLAEHGPNVLPAAPRKSVLSMFFAQFKEVLVLILIAAVVISSLLGEAGDAAVILFVVVINAVLGVVQEAKAENALAALKRLSQPLVTVVRGGRLLTIPTAGLVPGDLVTLETGNFVPADLRLTEAVNLRIEESALTGESLPVEKTAAPLINAGTTIGDRTNMAFEGTHLAYGRGKGLVVATGAETELGKIARFLSQKDTETTPLQKRLTQLGKVLGLAAVALVCLVFLAGIARGEEMLEMFLTSVSLAVAVVPEGLPAVVTIVLALGVQRMSHRRAIIRRLPAVETLGSATVICTDKTGTLTQNRMTAVYAYAGGVEYDMHGTGPVQAGGIETSGQEGGMPPSGELHLLLKGMALASDASLGAGPGSLEAIGDPTEAALVAAATMAGLDVSELRAASPRLDELPFDSERKRMTTVHPAAEEGNFIAYTKGAFDVLLPLCVCETAGGAFPGAGESVSASPLDPARREELIRLNERLASQGIRVLALALRCYTDRPRLEDLEKELIFVGLVGLADPLRPEAASAVEEARTAGIRTIMITGDHQVTAAAIAERLGIKERGDAVIGGAELDAMSDEDLAASIGAASVFARVSPEHKLRIVDALKQRGEVVAMTGDGINDAPALRKADIGAAMGITGTDVAKEAADMVITDDNFATVVEAVREGRVIYDNILKSIRYLLSCNAGELITVLAAILTGLGRPLTAIQILWTNLVTDTLPALALGMEPTEAGVMDRPPRRDNGNLLSSRLGLSIIAEGALIGLLSLAGFIIVLRTTGNRMAAGTTAFLVLSFSQLVHAFNTRSAHASIFSIGLLSNRAMLAALLGSLLLMLPVVLIPAFRRAFDVVPLTSAQWGLVVLLSFLPFIVMEGYKLITLRGRKNP